MDNNTMCFHLIYYFVVFFFSCKNAMSSADDIRVSTDVLYVYILENKMHLGVEKSISLIKKANGLKYWGKKA